jgi:class 3 adenylate cyclase
VVAAILGYYEPTCGYAAVNLERFGCERVAADRNGDVAAGRRRGLYAVVGNPARPNDRPLAQLNKTVNKVVAAHEGVRPLEQGEGDSFVAAFARASDAVACALALQHAPLAPIRLRIGLHTGEIQLRDEANYAGPTINRTARLRDLAHGGQTVLSVVTESLVVERLPDGV